MRYIIVFILCFLYISCNKESINSSTVVPLQNKLQIRIRINYNTGGFELTKTIHQL